MADAVTATAPTPAPAPAGSTLDARIALAKSMGAAPRLSTDPAPASAPANSPGENIDDDPAAATEAEAPETDEAEAEGEETPEPEAPAGTEAERITVALAAVEKGDIDAIVKALGADPAKVPAPTRRAFRAHARRIAAIERKQKALDESKAKAQQELSAESNRISQLQRHVGQKYGFVDEGKKAWDNEEYSTAAKAIEKWLGTDIATFTQKLVSGKSGKTEPEKALAAERAKLADERAAFEAEKKKQDTNKDAATKRETALSKFSTDFKHPYLVIVDPTTKKESLDQEAAEEVFNAYTATWNGEKFTKTAKQVADELQAKLVARAAKRGLAPVAAKPSVAPPKKPAVRAPRLPEPPREGAKKNAGTPEDLEASRALRIAQAKAHTERQRRGLVG